MWEGYLFLEVEGVRLVDDDRNLIETVIFDRGVEDPLQGVLTVGDNNLLSVDLGHVHTILQEDLNDLLISVLALELRGEKVVQSGLLLVDSGDQESLINLVTDRVDLGVTTEDVVLTIHVNILNLSAHVRSIKCVYFRVCMHALTKVQSRSKYTHAADACAYVNAVGSLYVHPCLRVITAGTTKTRYKKST